MLHGIGEGVVAVDDRGRIALLNDEAKRLLDVSDAALGRPATTILEPGLASMLAANGGADETVLAGERVLLARANAATVDHTPGGQRDHPARPHRTAPTAAGS